MDNQKKKEIMKQVDHYMAEHDSENIDKIFKNIQDDFKEYDKKFVQLLLGYTGVFKKVLKEWRPLFDMVDADYNK